MKQDVNYIKHHRNANIKMMENNLNSSHISLYNALFLVWNESGYSKTLSVNREDLMTLSKIGSKNTYVKCLRDLDNSGFIKYNPSKNPLKGSTVDMLRFDTSTGSSSGISTGSSTGSSMESSISTITKHINYKTFKQLNDKDKRDLKNLLNVLVEYTNSDNQSEDLTPFELIQKEKPTELETWEMHNRKNVNDYEVMVEAFNNKSLIEIMSEGNDLDFKSKMLIPRFKNFANAWIRNQKGAKVVKLEQQQDPDYVYYTTQINSTVRKCHKDKWPAFKANEELGGRIFTIVDYEERARLRADAANKVRYAN